MIRIYFASKLKHAPRWRTLCAESDQFIAHARWLKHNTLGTEDSPRNARRFWVEDVQDVLTADAVIVYAEGDDHLRGALIEAGAAIASGIRVYVVGKHPDYGTWQYHPSVRRARSLEEAINYAVLNAMED